MSEQTKIKHSPAVEGKKHHKVRWIVLAVLLAVAIVLELVVLNVIRLRTAKAD